MKITENSTVTVGLMAVLVALSFTIGRWIEWLHQDQASMRVWREDVMSLFEKIQANQERLIELANDNKRRLDHLEAAAR